MKNGVIGACLLVSPLAFAQAPGGTSSVQLYGRLDASVNAVRMSGTALAAARSNTLLSSDTSRWGVRGTEDLGGGHQAFFKLEQGFNADTGTLSSPTQAFNRETVVGLRHATLGSIALGSQFTPSIAMSLRIDPFQRSSMGAMQTLFQRGGAAGNLGYPVQYNNAIQYTSPNLGGFVGRVMVATNEGASPFGHPASYALEYAQGPLYVGAVYDRLNTTGVSAGQPGRASVSTDTISLGASYDLRVAKLYGYLIKSDVDRSTGMRGGSVGVKVPVGPGEINATYQVRNVNDAAGSDARLWAVQYLQPLSRRTSVYVSIAHQRNDGAAAFGLWPSRADAGGSPAAGADVRGVQVGMRHVF